jgi:hypothetical protein
MPIDTPEKRRAALATRGRRLPWLRRFTIPRPDGSISQADRMQLAGIYSGIAPATTTADPVAIQTLRNEPAAAVTSTSNPTIAMDGTNAPVIEVTSQEGT